MEARHATNRACLASRAVRTADTPSAWGSRVFVCHRWERSRAGRFDIGSDDRPPGSRRYQATNARSSAPRSVPARCAASPNLIHRASTSRNARIGVPRPGMAPRVYDTRGLDSGAGVVHPDELPGGVLHPGAQLRAERRFADMGPGRHVGKVESGLPADVAGAAARLPGSGCQPDRAGGSPIRSPRLTAERS